MNVLEKGWVSVWGQKGEKGQFLSTIEKRIAVKSTNVRQNEGEWDSEFWEATTGALKKEFLLGKLEKRRAGRRQKDHIGEKAPEEQK